MSRRPPIDVDSLSPVETRALLSDYLARSRAREKRLETYQPTERELQVAAELESKWFPQQRAFFTSAAPRRCAFTTRRGGKTIGTGIWLCASALRHPTKLHLYMAQTLGICKLYMWAELKRLILEYDLPFKTNETDLTITHERGLGGIALRGADKADEIEKLRGPGFIKVALDEASTFGTFMQELIQSVLGPTLLENRGHLILTGTAGKKKEGLFYEACHELKRRKSDNKPVYELHKWSYKDNPYIPSDAKNEDRIIDDNGFSGVDDPRFLREFRGVWAVGDTERVFSGYVTERNNYTKQLPSVHDWRFILGIDFGWHDESAMAVVAYATTCRTIYCESSWGAGRQYADDLARQVAAYRQEYGQRIRIVGDLGGYGKGIAVHLQRDHGIYVESASKRDKLDQIGFINSAFVRGELKVHATKCVELAKQLQEVAWNVSKTDMGNHERDDRAAALLYAWRAAKSAGAGSRSLSSNPYMDPGTALATKEKQDALRKRPKGDPSEPRWLQGEDDSDSGPVRVRPDAWRKIVGF